MKPRQPLSPAQMRTRSHERPVPEIGKPDPANFPPLAAETPRETDATSDWLAHVAAGRIQVR